MKKIFVVVTLLFFVGHANAQNVGIGTPNPNKQLHIQGNGEILRIQGLQPWIGFMNNTDADYKGFLFYPDTALVAGSAAGSNQPIVLAPNNTGLLYANAMQRVGIGTAAPAEKLDVNGSINIAGNLKVNNVAGQPNQVLMTNASGNTAWGSLCNYTRVITFYYPEGWIIPAGVTKVLFEAWGGGGGGAPGGGGAGGSYLSGELNVSPGEIVNINIGAGGAGSSTTGGNGGTTSLSGSFGLINYAYGGGGAFAVSPGIPTTGSDNFEYFYMPGQAGSPNNINYTERTAGQFVKIINYGQGGGCYKFLGSGNFGSTRVIDLATSFVVENVLSSDFARLPGIGGGGGPIGNSGANGRVIIYY